MAEYLTNSCFAADFCGCSVPLTEKHYSGTHWTGHNIRVTEKARSHAHGKQRIHRNGRGRRHIHKKRKMKNSARETVWDAGHRQPCAISNQAVCLSSWLVMSYVVSSKRVVYCSSTSKTSHTLLCNSCRCPHRNTDKCRPSDQGIILIGSYSSPKSLLIAPSVLPATKKNAQN